MSQGVDTSDMSISIEEDTQDNAKGPNYRRSGSDIKIPSPYDPSFEGYQYGDQLVNMNMEDNMTTAKT